MSFLDDQINLYLQKLTPEQKALIKSYRDNLVSVFPFNEYEFLLSHLLGFGVLSVEDYLKIRNEYVAQNLYLSVFEISAPRGFGEAWAQGHLKTLVPELQKPTTVIDPEYQGEYDFILVHKKQKIKIEVKASRAVDANSRKPLYVKALHSSSTLSFDMNFQQIKPACCEVFVWLAVWRDVIRYWVLNTDEVKSHKDYNNSQHRGNVGEGQLHIKNTNIASFSPFEVNAADINAAIVAAFERL